MRLQRAADVDVQPSDNGRPQLRLRSPEEVAVAPPSVRRRLVRPLPLTGVLLVVAALAGYWSVYSATTARTPVLVAAHDLQAGSVLRPSDLRTGELAGGTGPAAFTLVVPALRALGGALRPGDRVTVLATFDTGAGAQARALARGLRVLSVGQAPEGLDRASATVAVTVALSDPSLAAGLALANSAGKIDLLREGGSAATAPIPPASQRGGS